MKMCSKLANSQNFLHCSEPSGSYLLPLLLNAFNIASAQSESEFINTFAFCVPMENISKDIRESLVKYAAT